MESEEIVTNQKLAIKSNAAAAALLDEITSKVGNSQYSADYIQSLATSYALIAGRVTSL